MSKRVPNKFPSVEPGAVRLALVGQSPGQREEEQGYPFIGPSGELLDSVLSHVGISRAMCFVGNVSQVRPRANDFSNFEWDGPEVQAGIAQLKADLIAFQPTMILCLGNEALHLMKCGNVAPKKVRGQFVWPHPISSWRGSLFESDLCARLGATPASGGSTVNSGSFPEASESAGAAQLKHGEASCE